MHPLRLRRHIVGGLASLALLLGGCTTHRPDTLVQYSTINALLAGVYDGDLTFGDLSHHGDFGLGTFNALDGEMVALDGRFYQITASGAVIPVRNEWRTPFAVVTFFRPETVAPLADIPSFRALEQQLDERLPVQNTFYAVRIDGTFAYLKVRSVPRQQPPYPPLVEAAKQQSVFEFRNVTGTLVGFRAPEFVRGLNVPGYHFHFLAADRRSGGHVLDCQFRAARAEIDQTTNFLMLLPNHGAFTAAEIAEQRNDELDTVEKGNRQ